MPTASLDRSVSQLLSDRSDLGTLTVEGAVIDAERRPDGSIDLLDLLPKPGGPGPLPTTRQEPPPAIAVKVVRGVLKFRSPELPDGLTAETLDADIKGPEVRPDSCRRNAGEPVARRKTSTSPRRSSPRG